MTRKVAGQHDTPRARRARPRAVELVLYIGGATVNSRLAVLNIKDIGERFLPGRYHLSVIDLLQEPEQCRKHAVSAVPMLVRALPLPLRRMVGNLANEERVMIGLDLLHDRTQP